MSMLIFTAIAVPAVVAADTTIGTTIGGEQGWYDIYTNVDGCSIYFDGEYKGTTTGGMLSVGVYSTAAPYKTVTAEKSGYTSASQSLPVTPGAGEHQSVYLTLNPVTPTTGNLKISSSPSGAAVYVNSVYYGTTPHTVYNLPAGNNDLRLTYSGYKDYRDTVQIVAGQTQSTYAALTAEVTYGTLSVSSTPSNANIYLDGSYRGTAPRTIGGLSQGAHTLEVTMPGYQEWTNTINIHSNQVTYVTATLTADPQSTTGSISVTSNPSYASVYIDGVYYGTTNPGNALLANNIAAGSHTVKVTLSGYDDSVSTVTVNSGQTTTVSANLAGGATGNGAMDISSSPTGATVYLNNVNKGITPVTLSDLTPGGYTVTLELSGYTTWSEVVTVNSGATSTVSANLAPTTTATQSPAPLLPVIGALGACALILAARRQE
ncbi:PEGA domain-containing protein [Methanogenium organophilum]|uniref:PEGA domain-containing protein n=1 Tax=Methanogenium organophilum TaxID=2199 RepID=A0A9X9T8F2_METOG|nr:PEGA domain-containing protein [Methanogenium organophilum]WAI02109.1 PEGA domain-containing protein [Methanogenium organophilum]